MGRNYLQRDIKLLWGLAAARCSKPDCRDSLVEAATAADPEAIIGEIAHIVAHEDDGPRGDRSYPKEERDKYPNLVLLCKKHHTIADRQENTYTIEELREWKNEHETWVQTRLQQEMPNVSFTELEVVTSALMVHAELPATDFSLLHPAEKMRRNSLVQVGNELTMGLGKVREVGAYIEQMDPILPDFAERLKAGFIAEYRTQRAAGVAGDALFEALRNFAAGRRPDFRYQAAGLAVLVYLFEKCEVFEQ